MPENYDYDDESGDLKIVADSPDDTLYVQDGITSFEQLMMLINN